MRAWFITLVIWLSFSSSAYAGQHAPDFSLPRLGSTELISLSDFRGKVVYLDFWASWCGPCRTSMPLLDTLRSEFHSQGFEVLAINLDDTPQLAQQFLTRVKVNYPIAYDASASTSTLYNVQGMPTAFLIDGHGQILGHHQGFKPEDISSLRAAIQTALQSLPSHK